MRRRLTIRRLLATVLLLAIAALSACGGSDSDKNARDLLDTAFKKSVNSADIVLDAQLKLSGGASGSGPVRVLAKGPYRVNKGKLPSVDLNLTISPGGGQSISTGFLSTGDRAFVKFQDAYYEQPRANVAKANNSLASRAKQRGSLKSLGLDPRTWLRGAKQEGEEDVAGVKTTHVSGQLDVKNLMHDFNDLVRKSGGALGGSGTAVPKPLSDADINKVADVVKDPNFDVYVGKTDNVIRRVAGRLQFDVPGSAQGALGGLKGGSLEFSVELSNVNGNQRIEAPVERAPALGPHQVARRGCAGRHHRQWHGWHRHARYPDHTAVHRLVGRRQHPQRGRLQALRPLPGQGQLVGPAGAPEVRQPSEEIAAGV